MIATRYVRTKNRLGILVQCCRADDAFNSKMRHCVDLREKAESETLVNAPRYRISFLKWEVEFRGRLIWLQAIEGFQSGSVLRGSFRTTKNAFSPVSFEQQNVKPCRKFEDRNEVCGQ